MILRNSYKNQNESRKLVKTTKVSSKSVELAVMFPSEFELNGSQYVVAHDIKTIADIDKATKEGSELIFAFCWTPRQLRQFNYFEGRAKVSSFENDLDICQVFFCEDGLVAYCVSMYTCAAYTVFDEEFKEFEGIRMSHGIEFQIYRLVRNELKLKEQEEAQPATEKLAKNRKKDGNRLPSDIYKPLFPPEKFLARETPSMTDPSKTVKQYIEVSVKRFDGDDENPLMAYIQMYQEAPNYTGYLKGKTVYLPLGALTDFIDALVDTSEECDRRGLE